MSRLTLTTLLSCCLAFCPLLAIAQQTCNPRIPATTPTNRFTRHDNGTVVDKDTGLMWKTCREGQLWNNLAYSCELVAAEYDWDEALQHIVTLNNQGGFAEHTDWRLPNIKELLSLVERQCIEPAINLAVFPDFEPSWEGLTSSFSPHIIRTVSFYDGSAAYRRGMSSFTVHLVRDQ